MALTPVAAVTRHIPPPPSSSSISSPPRVFAPIPKRRKSMHRHHGHGGDDNANAAARATTPTTTTTTRSTFAFQGLHQHQQPAAEEDDDDDVDVEDEDGIDAELSRALQELVSLHNSNNHDGDNHDGPAASIPHGITTAGKASKMNGSIGVGAGAGVVIDKSQLLTAEELERTAEQLLEHCDAVNKTHNNTSNKPLASITNLPRFVASRSSPSPALVAADEDRLSDDYAARGGGKKRKVPSSAQQGPTIAVHGEFSIYRDERQSSSSSCVHSCGHTCGGGGSGAEAAAALADESASYDSGSEVCCEFHYKHSSVDETTGSGSGDPGSFSASRAAATRRIPPRKHTPARKACGFEKKLFQARKSQVLGLHADAIACMDKEHGQGKGSPNNTKTSTAPGSQQAAPTLDELEELVQALEYASVTGWEGDRVGSGAGMWEGQGKGWSTIKDPAAFAAAEAPEPQEDRLRWRKRGRALERSRLLTRDPIQRGGWIPEGSFEFEAASPLAKAISGRHQQLSLLRSKVTQLLTLTLGTPSMSKLLNSNNKPNKTTPTTATPKAAIKPAVQRTTKTTPAPTSVPASADKKQPTTKKVEPLPPTKNTPDIVIEPSADDPNYVPPPPPKGKKKKKRSANASNPHHVKNCKRLDEYCVLCSAPLTAFLLQTFQRANLPHRLPRNPRRYPISSTCSFSHLQRVSSTLGPVASNQRRTKSPPIQMNMSAAFANTICFMARKRSWKRRFVDAKRSSSVAVRRQPRRGTWSMARVSTQRPRQLRARRRERRRPKSTKMAYLAQEGMIVDVTRFGRQGRARVEAPPTTIITTINTSTINTTTIILANLYPKRMHSHLMTRTPSV